MDLLTSLFSILAVLLVGVISPGPSFLLVAQTAVSHSRRCALASALGMAMGATFLCILALVGVHAILQQLPRAYIGLKLIGAAYLFYLAFKLWRGAGNPVTLQRGAIVRGSTWRHFSVALVVMITNPKAAVQYGVLFGTFMPAHPPLVLSLLLPPCVFFMEASWYVFVAYALSAPRARTAYLGAKRHIDRASALLLGGMGLRLLAVR